MVVEAVTSHFYDITLNLNYLYEALDNLDKTVEDKPKDWLPASATGYDASKTWSAPLDIVNPLSYINRIGEYFSSHNFVTQAKEIVRLKDQAKSLLADINTIKKMMGDIKETDTAINNNSATPDQIQSVYDASVKPLEPLISKNIGDCNTFQSDIIKLSSWLNNNKFLTQSAMDWLVSFVGGGFITSWVSNSHAIENVVGKLSPQIQDYTYELDMLLKHFKTASKKAELQSAKTTPTIKAIPESSETVKTEMNFDHFKDVDMS